MKTAVNQQDEQWTSKRLLEWTTGYFAKAGIEQPRLCGEILLAHVLQCKRLDLYVQFDYCPTPEELARFRELIKRCAAHEPVGYLTGKAHFFNLELSIEPGVLIPRPETEVLVTEAIDFLRRQSNRPVVDVLDIGTGSGCIAIAIATNVVEAEVTACDISVKALELARRNVNKYDLQARVNLLESDMFSGLAQSDKQLFDLIVCNPPYISEDEYTKLPANVRDYEPRLALWGGVDGLEFYRRIAAEAEPFLADNGMIMVEIGYNQGEEVVDIFRQKDYLNEVMVKKDNLGHTRVVRAQKISY